MTETLAMLIIAFLDALDISSSMDSYAVMDRISENRNEEIGTVKVHDGCSKICLVFKNYPFVIKWSYGGGPSIDEALDEVDIYNDAVAANIAFFFPKTELFYTKNGISFVVQEKIDCSVEDSIYNKKLQKVICRITKTPTDKIYEKIQKEFDKVPGGYHRNLNSNWAKMAISLYGKKACKTLCQFVINHGINDLHENNLGYKNNKPIIIDFSGYHR